MASTYNYLVWGTLPILGLQDTIKDPAVIFFVDTVDADPRTDWVRQHIAVCHDLEHVRTVPILPKLRTQDGTAVDITKTAAGVINGERVDTREFLIRIYARAKGTLYNTVLDDRSTLLTYFAPDPAETLAVITTEYAQGLCGDIKPIRGYLRFPWVGPASLLGRQKYVEPTDEQYAYNRIQWANLMADRRLWIIGDVLIDMEGDAESRKRMFAWQEVADMVGVTINYAYIIARVAQQFKRYTRDYSAMTWQEYRKASRG